MNEVVLVAMGRSALGKASRGTLKQTRPEDIAMQVLAGVLKQTPRLSPKEIDDVVLGCAFPEAEQGINVGASSRWDRVWMNVYRDRQSTVFVRRACSPSSLPRTALPPDRTTLSPPEGWSQ